MPHSKRDKALEKKSPKLLALDVAPSIEDEMRKIAARVPDEEWDNLPPDLIDRLDYYVRCGRIVGTVFVDTAYCTAVVKETGGSSLTSCVSSRPVVFLNSAIKPDTPPSSTSIRRIQA